MFGWFVVFSATLNNISVLSWQSILLVEILDNEIMQSSYDYFFPSETKDL